MAPPPITPAPPSTVPAAAGPGPTPNPSAAIPPAAASKAQVARPPAVLGAPKGGVATGTTVNPCAVFARGLTEAATAESIRAAFAPFGVVKEGSAGVQIRPRKNGNERYAFVEFESPEGAAAAMRATVELDGVALGVEGKREKITAERVGGGGSGGGGRGGTGAGGGGGRGGCSRAGRGKGRRGRREGLAGREGRGEGEGGGGAREGQGEGGVRRISEEAFLKRDERERVFRHLILPPGSTTDPSESSSPPNSSARQDSSALFLICRSPGGASRRTPSRARGALRGACLGDVARGAAFFRRRGARAGPARARPLGRLAPRDRSSRLRTRAPPRRLRERSARGGSSEGSGSSLSRGGPTVGRRVAPGPLRRRRGRRPPRGAWRWTPPIASPWTTSARA